MLGQIIIAFCYGIVVGFVSYVIGTKIYNTWC